MNDNHYVLIVILLPWNFDFFKKNLRMYQVFVEGEGYKNPFFNVLESCSSRLLSLACIYKSVARFTKQSDD